MRVKVVAGFLLALLLGSCPCLAPLAAARPGGSDAHSCCAGSDRNGPVDGDAPSGGDMACCLRVPPSSTTVLSLELRVVGEAASTGPVACVQQKRPRLVATSVSPPGDSPSCRAASPRAPPVLA